jgi:hypothetical protein
MSPYGEFLLTINTRNKHGSKRGYCLLRSGLPSMFATKACNAVTTAPLEGT